MSELKPCPFCGGEAEYREYRKTPTESSGIVMCKTCRSENGCIRLKKEAYDAWNKRADAWISVDNEKPADGEELIMCSFTDGLKRWHKGFYKDGAFYMDLPAEIKEWHPTHWMKHPHPPSER